MRFYKVNITGSVADALKYSLLTVAGACINRGVTSAEFDCIADLSLGEFYIIGELEVQRIA